MASPTPWILRRPEARRLFTELVELDRAVYDAISRTPTPTLDPIMQRFTVVSNYSHLSMGASAILAIVGGRRGRRAALRALGAVGLTSIIANLQAKTQFRRPRPHRQEETPDRDVKVPASSSFPSGHTATAFAFAVAVSHEYPLLTLPTMALATVVGYARVHTGVHYPGDVVGGAMLGMGVGSAVVAAVPLD